VPVSVTGVAKNNSSLFRRLSTQVNQYSFMIPQYVEKRKALTSAYTGDSLSDSELIARAAGISNLLLSLSRVRRSEYNEASQK